MASQSFRLRGVGVWFNQQSTGIVGVNRRAFTRSARSTALSRTFSNTHDQYPPHELATFVYAPCLVSASHPITKPVLVKSMALRGDNSAVWERIMCGRSCAIYLGIDLHAAKRFMQRIMRGKRSPLTLTISINNKQTIGYSRKSMWTG